jgi:multiple sugar transport system ATP-binding protein
MTLADKIVVLNAGRIEQAGPPMELYRRPANLFVATFIGSPGMNILPVTLTGADSRSVTVTTAQGEVTLPRVNASIMAGASASLGLRPETLSLTSPDKSQLSGFVNLVERLGGETFAYVALKGFESPPIIVRLDGETELRIHDEVHLAIDSRRAHLFDADGLALGHAPDSTKETA